MAAAAADCCRRYPNGTAFSTILLDNDEDTSGGIGDCNNQGEEEKEDEFLLSVASYNLLAPLYVRPLDKRTGSVQPFAAFEWVPDENVLGIESRGKKLLESLQRSDADVICLQELELQLKRDNDGAGAGDEADSTTTTTLSFALPSWIIPILSMYEIRLPPQSELEEIAERNARVLGSETAVSCAVLYRKDRLQEVLMVSKDQQQQQQQQQEVDGTSRKKMKKKDKDGDTNTCVSVCLTKKKQRSGTSSTMEPIVVVTSVHLDATNEKKRVGQLSRCLRRAIRPGCSGGSSSSSSGMISTIIAGDMNSECSDGSCVSGFLSSRREPPCRADFELECASALRLKNGQKPTNEQLKEWTELYSEARDTTYDCCVSLNRVCTGATRSAYDHDDDDDDDGLDSATERTMKQWRLDHIFYTANSIQPTACWSTLEDDPESCSIGLPNHRIPSDHLPIGALFRVLPMPQFSEKECFLLLERIRDMEEKHKEGLIEQQRALDEEWAVLEARVYPQQLESGDDNKNNQGKKKKKKKSRGQPPPEEIVEFMRRKRTLVKQIKAKYKDERYAFIHEIGDLERLLIQQQYGCTARQWADKG